MTKEITSITDIKGLVDSFYDRVKCDALLAPIFNEMIQDDWPAHLNKMYNFWETVLLDNHTYIGNPFLPHAKLSITGIHFQRWLSLFNETLDDHFKGTVAEEAKWRANKMAQMFQIKLQYFQDSNSHPII